MHIKHILGLVFKRTLSVSLFVILSFLAYSQTYYFENYSVRDGLSNSKVYDILQDDGGYIWLATPSGLSRFDGESFKNFGTEDGIPENSIRALFLDSDRQLWLGYENGNVYLKTKLGFREVINDSIKAKGEISDITQNTNGDIIIGTIGAGLFIIQNVNSDQETISHFSGRDGIDSQIYNASAASDGRIFFATSVDMKYMDADSAKFHFFRPSGFPSFFLTTTLMEDTKANLWIGKHNGGLYKFDAQDSVFTFFDHRDGLAHNWVSTIFEDSKGQIWVGTWGGGVSLVVEDSVQVNFNVKNGLQGQSIQKITEDTEGNIYIATQENGFYIFKGNQFLSMTEDNGLPNEQIFDICEVNDSLILLATNYGVAVLEFSTSTQAEVLAIYNQKNEDAISFEGLISNKIKNLVRDKDGNIWIGSALSGIQKFNTKTREFQYDYVINSNLPKNAKMIHDLEVVGSDLYIATVDGLINYEVNSGKIFKLSQTDGLSDRDIETLYRGEQDKLWIGIRNGGINNIDKDGNITILEKTRTITPICFAESPSGQLWVGTFDGVFKLVEDSLVKVIDQQSGLLSNYVSLLHFMDDNRIVVGSNNGLNVYYLDSKEIIHYNKNVGYTGIETKTNSFLKRKDGVLLFGTTGGLMIYDTKTEDRKLKEAFIHLVQMKVNMEEAPMISGATFPYDENSFSFNYHAISLSNQTDLKYQVMLDGLDLGWREVTNSKNISFSQLPPGKYQLLVKAITFDGVENETPAQYSFTIRPPFWQTWWFISGSLLIIIASTFYGVRYRIYLLKKEKKILEQKVLDRTKEISLKNDLLAEKNKHITDSINYARRIQYAAMRPEEHLYQLYAQAFILYQPKDIVSGDFYWYIKKGKHLIIAAADCTGHGVPGAFMSMLGIAYLNEIVGRMNKFVASDILEKLRDNVINALHQSNSADTAKDGMDIALIILDTETRKLQFSGAYNPLYIIREGELIEQKGDRMPIGVHARDKEAFSNHKVNLLAGDQLYFFTDGFADQFGGPKGKKMNYKRFKNLILEQKKQELTQQRENMLLAFNDWKGEQEQLDDVLVIGVKV
ncbi:MULTISPECIES: two-component regulator propeller domain-containing protein [unclassified Lentimicrobium]|uniref:two-component regulator propeller domain-containing protein n=1 Tax=unclassified Lentimicrobium TaxID=2677434 RepID=UPI001551C23F|nr:MULTISPECIES: two-component regulator propeller domain-containing protein [unclassified Lentimicrobium]NPD47450.1 SpoIIE family protein phosphatase [Lentimicrobium sp. S6]NPD86328.1 SpoIIE family protein phosphatase [Lentimicrobium sp. L6]